MTLWSLGLDLTELRSKGAWEAYREWAVERREADRRRAVEETRRAEAIHDAIAAPRRRPGVRVDPQPGYLAITHPAWWDQQLEQWPDAGRPIFWRRRTSAFRVLRPGGRFFHILNRGGVAADERTVEGASAFLGDYEVMAAEEAWDRYGVRLGVGREGEMSARLGVAATDEIGLIHLDQPLAFADPPTLGDLRAAGVPYEREIVSGRGMTDAEVETVLRLGGLAA